jgi:hypothetical protein
VTENEAIEILVTMLIVISLVFVVYSAWDDELKDRQKNN